MAVGRQISLTPNIATKSVSATATAAQTSFTVEGGYRLNELGVYRNGVRLVQGKDFTASDGSTVTLLSGATVNDIIDFQIFDSFNIADAINSVGNQSISGNLTATKFIGDGSELTGVGGTGNINTNNIKVSGITTLGTETTVVGSAVTFNASGGTVVGVLTATSFSGSGSNLTGLPGGLGTAIAASGAGANIYYANKVLAIDTNLTTDVPDTSNIAYTQHQDLAVGSGVELVVSDGDQIVTDILGLSTSLGASALTGGGGVVRADNFTNRTGGAPTFPDGIKVSAGVVTVSDTTASTTTSTGALVVSGGVGIAGSLHVGENVSIGGTLTYEDVTNIDSVGLITARLGVIATAGRGVEITAGGLNVTAGIATFKNEVDADGGVDIAGGLKVAGITTLNSKLRIDIANGGTAGSGTAEGIFLRNTQETDNNAVTIFGGADDYNNTASAINFINVDHSANYGDISFDTRGSGSYSERLRITSAGNIGINSISPAEKLDVVGNIDIKGGSNQLRITTTSPAVKFTDSDAPTGFGMVGVNNTSGSLVLRSDDGNALSSSYMGFEVDGAEKLRITATGGLHLTNGELLERFASYTSSANFNGGNVDLDDGMVHYCNQNLSGANTVNLTSSVGINTQMANGDMISLTLITAVNASSAYINHITVDHSTTPTEMWVGGSAPGSGDGGTSNVDIYTFNLLKNGSNSYITIGNHIKTS